MIRTKEIRPIDWIKELRERGLKATTSRMVFLKVLEKETKPLSTQAILKKLPKGFDAVTLYRTLETLKEKGILSRADFQHGHAHYEILVGRAPHHHVICKNCGFIEDVPFLEENMSQKDMRKNIKSFSEIHSFTLEFFGICKKCK